ncbi:MAG: hypothetical protein WBS19_20880 [Candidatus Korobacteraceae bacterium]
MAKNVNDIIRKLNAAQVKKTAVRAAQLIAEERTRREARKPTSQRISKSFSGETKRHLE